MPPKRRRRFQGLYYHSSPPKVIPMNGQILNGRRRRETDDFSVKLSTIRIWMHEKDIGKLTRLLWAGQGHRLSQQASTNGKVKRFLAAVPYVMNAIKDVHQAVIDNSLETLQNKVEPPVPASLITCKDANGLNIVHKAAGLGHAMILEYLLGVWPDGINETDITGKTPLHWAASAKNNMRCYTLLTQAGADEEALDYKMKSPSYYRHKPHEIERAFLVYLPEAPRVSPGMPTDWEALVEDGGDGKKLDIKIPEINGIDAESTADDISDADANDGSAKENGTADAAEMADAVNGNATPETLPTPDTNDTDESNANAVENEEAEVVEPTELDDEVIALTAEENNSAGRIGFGGRGIGTGGRGIGTGGRAFSAIRRGGDRDLNEPLPNDNGNEQSAADDNVDNGDDANKHGDEVEKMELETDAKESASKEENASESDESPETAPEEAPEETPEEASKEAPEEAPEEASKDAPEEAPEEASKEAPEKASEEAPEEESKEAPEEASEEAPEEAHEGGGEENAAGESENGDVDETTAEGENKDEAQTEESGVVETDEQNDPNANEKTEEQDEVTAAGDDGEATVNDEAAEATAAENDADDEDKTVDDDVSGNVEASEAVEETSNNDNADEEAAIESQTNAEENANKLDDENKKDDEVVETAIGDGKKTQIDAHAVEDDDEDEADVIVTPTVQKFDVNHNEPAKGNAAADEVVVNGGSDDLESHTSSLAIEGFVHGVSEDNTVQSQSAALIDEELNLEQIIASGDMEQLAQIVLNGDGGKLLRLESGEPEIQAFLNNVPTYMSKIRRVHEAARTGSLLALQQALDRRKFAIAKDDISPQGATPLHVAVLFGHSDIVRYLAARFPETTGITDQHGRTALHYAATIKDNGHFYNLLTQLGANAQLPDTLGHTPEFYADPERAKDVLTYGMLLKRFGAEELEEELLTDQVPDDLHSSRRLVHDAEVQRTLDRCFSVIQESSKVLSGATASALSQRKPLSASSLQLSVTSYLSRFLKRSVYEKIKKRQTRLDHNLFDVIWPAMRKTSKLRHLEEDINCGIIAPDFDVFVVFQEFLVPLLKDMHCMSLAADFKPHPRLAFFPMESSGARLNTADLNFDDESKLVQSCKVECSRNLEDFELPLNLTVGQIEQAERLIMGRLFTVAFTEAIGETESGSYYTLTEILEENSEVLQLLTALGLMIPLLDTSDAVQEAESTAFNGALWPYGRGVYLNGNHTLALWVNCQEHLRVISTTSGENAASLGAAYTRVGRAVTYLEKQLHFKESYLLGYLQARPSYLGTGLKLSTTVKLPNLMKEMDNLRHLCSVRGLSLITMPVPLANANVRVVNMQSLGTMEYVLFQDYCTAVTNILSLEKDMSLTNSKHIASMLVKIFRRQTTNESPNSFLNNPIFKTEQGKYLASTLADPLIAALTEIAHTRPADPVAFLANFLQNYTNDPKKANSTSSDKTSSTTAMNSSSPTRLNATIKQAAQRESLADDDIEPAGDDDDEFSGQAQTDDRDEHGQSMLHFACARSHRRGGLIHLIQESNIDITYRDELYRTARDVSLQANQPANAKEIDRHVLSLAVVGDLRPFEHFTLNGYDHVVDVTDDNGKAILDIVNERGLGELAEFLGNLRALEELREELHQMIRDVNFERVREIMNGPDVKWLLRAKNYYGRTALHIAVLKESEEIVELLVGLSADTLKIGDNLERTALHYAMGTNAIESLSRILIQNGAKRTTKDLKGRQPTYYFMNKADILRLQEEEEETR